MTVMELGALGEFLGVFALVDCDERAAPVQLIAVERPTGSEVNVRNIWCLRITYLCENGAIRGIKLIEMGATRFKGPRTLWTSCLRLSDASAYRK